MTPLHRTPHQTFTPLLTPFTEERLDIEALEAAVDRQIIAGVNGIVVCDVVGEGQILAPEERDVLLRTCIGRAQSHIGVIAATGTNCTQTTIERCRRAESLGADALLVTIPYYSKPTMAGVVDHFRQVAAAVGLPILIDDDPDRTARDYGSALLEALDGCPAIAGISHGTDRLTYFAGLPSALKSRFLHLTRDDRQLTQFLALGGDGAVSPVANVIPSAIQTVVSIGGSFNLSGTFGAVIANAIAVLGREDVAALKEAASFLHQWPTDMRLPLVAAEPETVIRIRRAFAPFARSEANGPIAA